MPINSNLNSYDAVLDERYGKPGTPERDQFRREAYAYSMGQEIASVRKKEKMSQSDLAAKVGTDKTYISRIERGLIEPGIGLFCQIAHALGMEVEMVKVSNYES